MTDTVILPVIVKDLMTIISRVEEDIAKRKKITSKYTIGEWRAICIDNVGENNGKCPNNDICRMYSVCNLIMHLRNL